MYKELWEFKLKNMCSTCWFIEQCRYLTFPLSLATGWAEKRTTGRIDQELRVEQKHSAYETRWGETKLAFLSWEHERLRGGLLSRLWQRPSVLHYSPSVCLQSDASVFAKASKLNILLTPLKWQWWWIWNKYMFSVDPQHKAAYYLFDFLLNLD